MAYGFTLGQFGTYPLQLVEPSTETASRLFYDLSGGAGLNMLAVTLVHKTFIMVVQVLSLGIRDTTIYNLQAKGLFHHSTHVEVLGPCKGRGSLKRRLLAARFVLLMFNIWTSDLSHARSRVRHQVVSRNGDASIFSFDTPGT